MIWGAGSLNLKSLTGVLDPLEINGPGTNGLAHLERITSAKIPVGRGKVEDMIRRYFESITPTPWSSTATH